MTSRSFKNHHDWWIIILLLHFWWIQNCRQQKIYNRLCPTSVLCIFLNKARRPRQTMGSSYCYKTCGERLRQWTSGTSHSMGFGIPILWREATNHVDNCYFCSINMKGVNIEKPKSLSYKCFPSAIWPVAHNTDISVLELKSCLISSLLST